MRRFKMNVQNIRSLLCGPLREPHVFGKNSEPPKTVRLALGWLAAYSAVMVEQSLHGFSRGGCQPSNIVI